VVTFYCVILLIPSKVIQSVPNAIGALCLNEAGQAQLAGRPSVIPSIFSIFTSDRHLRVLLDKEHAALIGTAIDELIRHHPTLKAPVFEAVKATLSKIEDLGNAYQPPADKGHWYQLMPTDVESDSPEVTMEDLDLGTASDDVSATVQENSESSSRGREDRSKQHDNNIVSFIDVLGRVSSGLSAILHL
jgi:E3 ubiquitin-protein ligase HUWE1